MKSTGATHGASGKQRPHSDDLFIKGIYDPLSKKKESRKKKGERFSQKSNENLKEGISPQAVEANPVGWGGKGGRAQVAESDLLWAPKEISG